MRAAKERLFHVPSELAQQTLAAALRHWLPGQTWAQARKLIESRRIMVSGNLCLDPARRLKAGEVVKVLAGAAPEPPREAHVRIRHLDAHLVVVEKPAGMTTVRHPEERDWSARRKQLQPTLDEILPRLIAAEEKRRPQKGKAMLPRVRAVHRLDRETSGLMVFARTVEAERSLGQQFRKHTIERRYLAIVHGRIDKPQTIATNLVRDRGDGRRGSTTLPRVGKRAVTHITPIEALGAYTLIECRLETGRTHQIRIHLAEAGHMLCGEKVYHQPLFRPGKPDASGASRIMLHAAELGFEHPVTGERLLFKMDPPEDFRRFLARIRKK